MYFTAEIQAREPERARLAAAFDSFVAAGKQVHHLPGPGEQRAAGVDHRGVPQYLPAGEQTQHIHREPRHRMRALDKVSWENREALIERYRERVLEGHAQGLSEASISTALHITRAQVRIVASAAGVTLRQRAARKKAEQPAAAKPARSEQDTARELASIRRETAAALAGLERLSKRAGGAA